MLNMLVNKVIPAAILCLSINVWAANADINSHEYKLLLHTHLFEGDRLNQAHKVNAYWDALKNTIEKGDFKSNTTGSLSLDKNRTVAFYDVKGSCELSNAGYSFRERIDKGKREVTLKFLSADQDMAKSKDLKGKKNKAKSKFEEDISAPFVIAYCPSTTQKIAHDKNLNKMDDPIGLHPGLKGENFNSNLTIEKVNNLTINEYVYKHASVDLGSLDAEFSLTLWYNDAVSSTDAIVAEISFKYEEQNTSSSHDAALRAKALFTVMQQDQALVKWNAPASLTKTATVYQYKKGFCY
jgi:hypothetical protein